MTDKSLFQPAASAQRHLKVLLHGGPGTGKTRAALSFPGPLAVLDLEGGTSLYDGDFQVLRTKDIRVIEQAINELARGGYATVVIDPLTVLWHLLQDAGQTLVDTRRGGKDSLETGQALSPREWGLIKRKYNSLLTRLVNLPMHVVLIARDTDLYEGTGDQLKRVGTKADAEKGTPYLADFVFSMQTEPGRDGADRFVALVEKSRAAALPKGARLTDFTAGAGPQGFYTKHLNSLAQRITPGTGAGIALQDDADVAAGNAGTLDTPPAPAPAGRPQAVRVDTGATSGARPAPVPAQDSAATQEPTTDQQRVRAVLVQRKPGTNPTRADVTQEFVTLIGAEVTYGNATPAQWHALAEALEAESPTDADEDAA
jgi:hypothetical protein